MIPNDEQLLAIKQYLHKHLRYRETEAEIYDHILTALEQVPAAVSFGDAMNTVIDNIGGLKGIALIERAAKMAAIRALIKSYVETLKQIFTSPLIMVVALFTLVGYCLINKYLLTNFSFMLTMMLMTNMPTFVLKRSVLKRANLTHVKNHAFKIIYQVLGMFTPAMLFLSLGLRMISNELFLTALPYIATLTFCISTLNAAVLYKLTRKEFQVKLMEV